MNLGCDGSSRRAVVQSLIHAQVDMYLSAGTFNICYDYIFQLEQFFDTIFVEHWAPPLGFVSQLYSTGFRHLMLAFLLLNCQVKCNDFE